MDEVKLLIRSVHINPDYVWVGLLLTVTLGSILGFARKIVVFRNFDDLGVVFLVCLVPVIYTLVGGDVTTAGARTVLTGATILLEVGLLLWISIRTFQDNPNPLLAIIALATKLPLSVLFIMSLLGYLDPHGKSEAERARNRRSAAVFLAILTPIIVALVRERKGVFNPMATGRRSLSLRGRP